jgi:hypothetical protein
MAAIVGAIYAKLDRLRQLYGSNDIEGILDGIIERKERLNRLVEVQSKTIATIVGADIMRKFVIVLGFCLTASPAAFAQTTTTDLNRPGQPAVAGEPFTPFPLPQYNVPGPQLTVPQTGNALQQAAPLGSPYPSPGSPTAQLSPLGSTINPVQPAPASPLGSIVNPVQPAPGSTFNMVQQLGLQPQLQPGLPEAY